MAELKGTVVGARLVPTDDRDSYATHEALYGRGGHRSVNTIAERDAIPVARREKGMTVYVATVPALAGKSARYVLEGGIENSHWVLDVSEGSGGDSGVSESDMNDAINNAVKDKVDKVAGKQLSDENYTTTEKTKLANLRERFLGTFETTEELNEAVALEGDYAYLIDSEGKTLVRYYDGDMWVVPGTDINPDDLNLLPNYNEQLAGKVLSIGLDGELLWVDVEGGGVSETLSGNATITLGGVNAGDSLDGLTPAKALEKILTPTLNPTLVEPSNTLTSSHSGLMEIGTVIDVTLTSTFNRGSITPQYNASEPYRAGVVLKHTFDGPSGQTVVDTSDLTTTHTISDYEVINSEVIFRAKVDYDVGPQPTNSKGEPYQSQLPLGATEFKTVKITGVYPVYSGKDVMTRLPLAKHGSIINVEAPDDTDESGVRFSVEYPTVWSSNDPVVEQLNELSGLWDVQSASEFTVTDISKNGTPYKKLTYNGSGIGSRTLRVIF